MSNKKTKILIVDDSSIIQKLLCMYIKKQSDFEVVGVCEDPFQASQYLSQHEVDCMILDLELPKMDGITFLKKLNQSFKVNTIVISGVINSKQQLKEKVLELGAIAAMAKPNGKDNELFFSELLSNLKKCQEALKLPVLKNDS